MKKIWIVVFLVVAIIIGGIVEQIFIFNTFVDLEIRSQNIYDLLEYEKYDEALEATQETKVWWYNKRDVLEFLCSNIEVKDIARELGELEGSQLAKAHEDSLIRTIVLREMAINSKNLLAYKFKNVF